MPGTVRQIAWHRDRFAGQLPGIRTDLPGILPGIRRA
jgi:hypothetical protein